MQKIKWKLEQRFLNELIPHVENPRIFTEKGMQDLKKSLKNIGMAQPINITRDGVILSGHARVMALKDAGEQMVDVYVPDRDLTDEEQKEILIRMNANTAGEWDFEKLANEWESDSLIEWGLDVPAIEAEELADKEIIEDEVPEEVQTIAKRGQVWKLGNHRLMCGDSTSMTDVETLMDGKKADLLMTDPPYNVAVKNSQGMKIENDDMDEKSFLEFLTNAFKCAIESLRAGGAFYIWLADYRRAIFQEVMKSNSMLVRECLIWVKNSFTLGRQDYQWQHEPCLYGWKDGASHYFVDERNHSTVIEDKPDLEKMTKDEIKELCKQLLTDRTPTTVIHENKPKKDSEHPTMKPNNLIAPLIRHSSKINELVLDLFGGSGTTLICCEQLDRVCYMMEYDPHYCDVIIQRWENLTGKKADLIIDVKR